MRLEHHKHYVQGVAWDPLSAYLLTLSSDRSCRYALPAPRQLPVSFLQPLTAWKPPRVLACAPEPAGPPLLRVKNGRGLILHCRPWPCCMILSPEPQLVELTWGERHPMSAPAALAWQESMSLRCRAAGLYLACQKLVPQRHRASSLSTLQALPGVVAAGCGLLRHLVSKQPCSAPDSDSASAAAGCMEPKARLPNPLLPVPPKWRAWPPSAACLLKACALPLC